MCSVSSLQFHRALTSGITTLITSPSMPMQKGIPCQHVHSATLPCLPLHESDRVIRTVGDFLLLVIPGDVDLEAMLLPLADLEVLHEVSSMRLVAQASQPSRHTIASTPGSHCRGATTTAVCAGLHGRRISADTAGPCGRRVRHVPRCRQHPRGCGGCGLWCWVTPYLSVVART